MSGPGSNFRVYPEDVIVHGVDVSRPALSIAAERAVIAGRRVTVLEADAGALPYADDTFDTVVATFVLCSVEMSTEASRGSSGPAPRRDDPTARARSVRAAHGRRAAGPGRASVGALSGGCRLDHDVLGAVRSAQLSVIEARQHFGGTLIEIVAA